MNQNRIQFTPDGIAAEATANQSHEHMAALGTPRVGVSLDQSPETDTGTHTEMPVDGNAASIPATGRSPRIEHLSEGARRLAVVLQCRALLAQGLSWRQIAEQISVDWQAARRWVKSVEGIEAMDLTAERLAKKTYTLGAKPKLAFNAQEAATVKALQLETNRSERSGSMPEALRRASKQSLLRPEVAEFVCSRMAAGKAPLTPSMRDQVRVAATVIEAERQPRNAWLNHVTSPGSLMLTVDDETGAERYIQPGEKFTIDDGTINFACCVPLECPGNKCWEKFGVMVGRFQFLLVVDHRTRFVTGFSYTARPRSSYRAEDLLATMQNVFAQHGVPKAMILEKGISASNSITRTLGLLGVQIERASSPHQKVVEIVFNNLWTRLSGMPGQVGRFRGEEEEMNRVLTSCQNGGTDPRKVFPSLPDVLRALREVIADYNAHTIVSKQYGQWIPRDWFAKEADKNLRKLPASDAWMFSPVATDPLTVRGFLVRKTVNMMPGLSLCFDFSADWLHEYDTAQVQLFFNPFAPDCEAVIVLAQDFNGERSGTVLGSARQINRTTRYGRRMFGYADDPDIGLDAVKQNAQALRRSVVGIKTDGSAGVQTHEHRNGLGQGERLEASGLGRDSRSEVAEMAQPRRDVVRQEKRRLQNLAEDALATVED